MTRTINDGLTPGELALWRTALENVRYNLPESQCLSRTLDIGNLRCAMLFERRGYYSVIEFEDAHFNRKQRGSLQSFQDPEANRRAFDGAYDAQRCAWKMYLEAVRCLRYDVEMAADRAEYDESVLDRQLFGGS